MFRDAGYEVIVVTKIFSLRTKIESDGVRIIDVPFSRASLNPFREFAIIWRLRRIYAQEKPDIVYHVAFKPVLFGSLAAIWKAIPLRVNAIAGMGQLFLSKTLKIRFIRWFVTFVLRRLFKDRRNILIAQNQVDQEVLSKSLRLKPEQTFLIRGVGVDLDEFRPNLKTGHSKSGSDPLKGESNSNLKPTPAQGLPPFSNPELKSGSDPLKGNPPPQQTSLPQQGLPPFSGPNKTEHLKMEPDPLKGESNPKVEPTPAQGLPPFSNPAPNQLPPIITLVARLIAEKGIHELVAAARILKSKNIPCRIWLVGEPDTGSPQQISVAQIQSWESQQLIEWKKHREDINAIYNQTDIAVLPSYSEGLPKSLLEACACGLPIVTTDVSGCIEVVEHNVNGLIVPVKDSNALAAALERLVSDQSLRERLGCESRRKADAEFSSEIIIDQIRSICRL